MFTNHKNLKYFIIKLIIESSYNIISLVRLDAKTRS